MSTNTNFEKIEQAINNPSAELSPEEIGEKIKENNEEMYREIRAIITPDMSPLEVTEQVEQAKTDSKTSNTPRYRNESRRKQHTHKMVMS